MKPLRLTAQRKSGHTGQPESTCEVGTKGEDYVCAKLKERRFRILERNVREKFAEIDIVAQDRGTLCFIEVRTRQDTTFGHPAETITKAKQHRIRQAAQAYLAKRNIPPCPIRFDVATIVWSTSTYEYFENAF